MQTPALILEAKHHHRPSPEKVVEHRVLPGEHVIVPLGKKAKRLEEGKLNLEILGTFDDVCFKQKELIGDVE